MGNQKSILWRSFVLTILIFTVGILLNHFFDIFRISTISGVIQEHEIDREAYSVELLFAEQFGGETCEVMNARISDFNNEIRKVGEDLGSYSRFSFFRKKDYDYLKRKYFLLELRFLAFVKKTNQECGNPYLPIVFFYKIDDSDSEKQGFILQDLSKDYDRELVVLSLDVDYKDEPLLDVLADSYNITKAPVLVIDDEKFEGLQYAGQLNSSIRSFLMRSDPYAGEINFLLVPEAANISVQQFKILFDKYLQNSSEDLWSRGDAQIAKSRLLNDKEGICRALEFYDRIESTNPEEQALKYETIASLGCGRNRAAFLRAAANEWSIAGNVFRAGILEKLASGERLNLQFDKSVLDAKDKVISGYQTILTPILPENVSSVIIGETAFAVTNKSIIVSQDDRVFRDWLSGQLASPYGPNLLRVFSERLTYNESELHSDIGWHEGARIFDLLKLNATHFPAVGTLIARKNNRWFAVDDKGIFRFEVPIDKVSYPTTRFLRRDLAVIIDTHGVNMLVEQAIRHNASLVIGCCDHPGKIYAADYLSDKGVDVVCLTDKYLYTAIGRNLSVIGSPPLTVHDQIGILGGRSITLGAGEKIVAVNSSDEQYALWYYQTPASYIETIVKAVPLNVTYVTFDDFNQMHLVAEKAREIDAHIIAARVFTHEDYDSLSSWLSENSSNKAILFHSASYPYGQMLFSNFINQTSFDDPNPVWVNAS